MAQGAEGESATQSLETLPSSVIEQHLLSAMDYGKQSFEVLPGVTVTTEEISTEFTRRQQATSEFNRP